jgi:hypothetical protein
MSVLPLLRKMTFWLSLLLSVSYSTSANSSVETGLAWLKQQQVLDGSFVSTGILSTPFQATSEALNTFSLFSTIDPAQKSLAISYLRVQPHDQLEDLSRWVQTSVSIGDSNPTFLQSLNPYLRPVGGYSDYVDYDHSAHATAFALQSLNILGAEQTVNTQKAVTYLLNLQQKDGGWAEEENLSSVYVTALVNRVLQSYRFKFTLGPQIAGATQYLLNNQVAQGGWQNNLDTALALLTIIPVTPDVTKYQFALTKLRDAQAETALALQALYFSQNVPVIPEPTSSSITGQILATVSGLPLANSQVELKGPTPVTLSTNASGKFEALNLLPGSYEISVKASGYLTAIQTINLPTNRRLDIGQVNLSALTNFALVAGTITDAVQHLPLVGVTVQVTGASTAQTQTDANGRYSIEVNAGNITLKVSHPGYQLSSASTVAAVGEQITFSPTLYLLTDSPPSGVALRGQVIDAENNKPLPNALVTSGILIVLTDNNGEFILSGLSAGDINVSVTLAGYRSVSINGTASQGSVIDLGRLSMLSNPVLRTEVAGIVTDIDTGKPIVAATVTIGNQVVQSDQDGVYRITNVETLEFTVIATAPGYLTSEVAVTLSGVGKIRVDIPLKKIVTNGVSIENLSVERTENEAFSQVNFTGKLKNVGTEKQNVLTQIQIVNSKGALIEERLVSPGIFGGLNYWSIKANEEISLPISWLTGSYTPGQYRILLSVSSVKTLQLLDQKETVFTILPTTKIAYIKLVTPLDHVNQGTTESVSFQADIRNQSNIPVTLNATYDLFDPKGTLLHTYSTDLRLEPTSIFSTQALDSFNQSFALSGEYTFKIRAINGIQPQLVVGGIITSSPNIRIDVIQNISPKVTVPGDSVRTKVQIRLEGVEM